MSLVWASIWIGGSGNGDVYASGYIADITFVGTQPMVAYSCPYPVAQLTCVNNGNGTWTVRLHSLSPQDVDWYVFNPTPAYRGPGAGVRIFNEAQVPVFDARTKYARVADVLSGRIARDSDGYGQYAFPGAFTQPYSYPGRGKLAVGAVLTPITTLSGGRKDEGAWSGILGMGGWSTGSGVVYQSFYHWRFGPKAPNPPAYNYDFGSALRWNAMVLDVSAL
ncbi:hypothetical protein [Pandoraea pneumonica]|uniref:hypothetical protein n=1 Tax=Pandoraea pneumonica TaxID=2508299 RepID=UPI001240AE08|nr:hypothetical protein [Pandoraea pneumonica]